MKISTARFGEITAEESELITMKGPILGFEHHQSFVLVTQEDDTPLCWLQSAKDSALAFVVIDPRVVRPDYAPLIAPEQTELLDIKNIDDMALLAIVTVGPRPLRVTANLKAPIVINTVNRTAAQVVLDDHDYPVQYDIRQTRADTNRDIPDA